jgi:hypothetical protein
LGGGKNNWEEKKREKIVLISLATLFNQKMNKNPSPWEEFEEGGSDELF